MCARAVRRRRRRELEEHERGRDPRRRDRAAAHRSRRSARACGVCRAAVWLVPIVAVAAGAGPADRSRTGVFFSKAALVTFGGAYAVLAYVVARGRPVRMAAAGPDGGRPRARRDHARARSSWSWSSSASWARTSTPATCRRSLAGVLGALVATWATFAPCFLWIFLGAPYVERLRGNRGSRPRSSDHRGGRRRDREPRADVRHPDAVRAACGSSTPSAARSRCRSGRLWTSSRWWSRPRPSSRCGASDGRCCPLIGVERAGRIGRQRVPALTHTSPSGVSRLGVR